MMIMMTIEILNMMIIGNDDGEEDDNDNDNDDDDEHCDDNHAMTVVMTATVVYPEADQSHKAISSN